MHLRNGKLDNILLKGKGACVEDTSLCLEQLLVFSLLKRAPQWSRCVIQRYGEIPQLLQVDHSLDMSITDHWSQCMEERPRVNVNWNTGLLNQIMVPSYVEVLETFSKVYHEVRVIRSEVRSKYSFASAAGKADRGCRISSTSTATPRL